MGRRAFGAAHSRNVVIAIVLFFVGLVVEGILIGASFFMAQSTIVPGQTTAAQLTASLTSFVNDTLLSAIVGAVITGLASVFFTYALQNQAGKLLLWAAYGANVALQVAIYLIVSPLIGPAVATAVNQSMAAGSYQSAAIDALTAQITAYSYLTVISALLYTGANYLAWSRIKKGEIPEGGAAAPSPYGAQPPYLPPPMPPQTPPGGTMPPTPPATPPPSTPPPT